MNRPQRFVLMSLIATSSLSCGGAKPDGAGETPPGPRSTAEPNFEYLRDEARQIVAFLRGTSSLDGDLLADSVTFRVAAEGGGERRTAGKQALQDREAWRVGEYSLLPPPSLTELGIHPGSHVHCQEVPLQSRFPGLGATPHVGIKLTPSQTAGCLQTWNITLLFSEGSDNPVLVGVAYDQWEW